MQLDSFPRGDVIFKEGDPSNGKMHVIVHGMVAIVRASASNPINKPKQLKH
jgi:CRP-like cAMP-binding protein